MLVGGLAFTLGALAAVNLWDLPTYLGLGVLALGLSHLYRRRRPFPCCSGCGASGYVMAGGAYLLYHAILHAAIRTSRQVASGLCDLPDDLGNWAQIWGFFAFVIFTWLVVGRGEFRRDSLPAHSQG